MQKQDGTMRMLDAEQFNKAIRDYSTTGKIVSTGEVFKIKRTYFQISEITSDGIVAKGISRREYFDRK